MNPAQRLPQDSWGRSGDQVWDDSSHLCMSEPQELEDLYDLPLPEPPAAAAAAVPPARYAEHEELEMRPGPTPFEVWMAKKEVVEARRRQRRLTDKGWDRLILHLHNSERVKRKVLQQQQHQALAEELVSLPFKPQLNTYSLEIAAHNESLEARRNEVLKTRDDFIMRQRELKLKDELKDCTFRPYLCSAAKSEVYLQQSNQTQRTLADIMNYAAEKRLRRKELKQALEEIASRELTFTPQLTRASALIVSRMKKQGRLTTDQVTGQTIAPGRPQPTNTCKDPGHEQETFEPVISSRSSQYRIGVVGAEDEDVYARLYGEACERTARTHNEVVLAFQQSLRNCFTRPFETTEKQCEGKAAWVEDIQEGKRSARRRVEDRTLRGSEEPVVNVVTYTARIDPLVRRFNPRFHKAS